jgi:hypothetical protein
MRGCSVPSLHTGQDKPDGSDGLSQTFSACSPGILVCARWSSKILDVPVSECGLRFCGVVSHGEDHMSIPCEWYITSGTSQEVDKRIVQVEVDMSPPYEV